MMNTRFLGEPVLQTISERGRALIDRRASSAVRCGTSSSASVELCEHLLSGRGEASGVALAREIIDATAN